MSCSEQPTLPSGDFLTASVADARTPPNPILRCTLRHVDDLLYGRIIEQLRDIYSFGSYDEGEFVFTGIRFRQWDHGSIEMDQDDYIERISPFHVPRDRRLRPEDPLTASEVHELRRLNGSLQYAAVHNKHQNRHSGKGWVPPVHGH